MKRILKYIAVNTIFFGLMYLAYFEHVAGAEKVVLLWAWVGGFVAIAMCVESSKADIKDSMRKKGRAVYAWIDVALDILVVGAFAWFGAMFTAVVYLAYVAFSQGLWAEIKKEEELTDEKTSS